MSMTSALGQVCHGGLARAVTHVRPPTTARAWRPHTRGARQGGLTLIEVVISIAIVGVGLVLLMEATTQTIQTAEAARNRRLAYLVLNDILARECLGNLPENAEDDSRTVYNEQVDVDRYGPEYARFTYTVQKTVETVTAESSFAPSEDELEEQQEQLESDESIGKLYVIKIEVTVEYMIRPGEAATISGATYVVDEFMEGGLKLNDVGVEEPPPG